jgi:transposase
MATWITGPISERCPNASVCYDPFHLIKLSTDALDEIRREVWNGARRQGHAQLARELKGARFALWKNPAICETDVVYRAETCIRVGACT